MNKQVLMLNSDYQPMNVISWQKAVSLWFSDKVEIVEEYDDEDITSVSFSMKCPAVVRLYNYVRRASRRRVKFSRLNVFSRDSFRCQYCGDEPGISKLTFDHVLPKAEGGRTCWENIVASCKPCNYKKADKGLIESNMKLMTRPKEPSQAQYLSFRFLIPKTPDAWRNYLYWNAELKAKQ